MSRQKANKNCAGCRRLRAELAALRTQLDQLQQTVRDLQQQLRKQGWGMRVYIPFGTEWYPYFMRRLAERPANALFVLKNLFQ